MTAYAFFMIDVTDPESYPQYMALTPANLKKYGGKFFFRNQPREHMEGEPIKSRIVILEFESKEAIKTWYSSEEYQAIKQFRVNASTSSFFIFERFSEDIE